jgi:hypothetical protein
MNLKKSLQTIKKELRKTNNSFHTIRTVYTHLSDLTNEEILDYYNVESITELTQHIETLKTNLKNRQGNYEKEIQELDTCFCRDSRGDFKYLYLSKKEAEAQIKYSFSTKRIKLKLYPCPYHCGWHLSKV